MIISSERTTTTTTTTTTKKRPKRKVDALQPVQPRPNAEVIKLGGKKFILPDMLGVMIIGAFNFGYCDVWSFKIFKIYVTTLTGNLLQLVLHSDGGHVYYCLYCAAVIFCNCYLGVQLSAFFLECTGDRRKALSLIITLTVIVFIVMMAFNNPARHGLLPIAIMSGAQLHWLTKTGFSTAVHTLNLHKISESFYRYTNNVHQGGQKLRGDLLVTVCVVLSFILGAVVALITTHYAPSRLDLLPVTITTAISHFAYGDSSVLWRDMPRLAASLFFSSSSTKSRPSLDRGSTEVAVVDELASAVKQSMMRNSNVFMITSPMMELEKQHSLSEAFLEREEAGSESGSESVIIMLADSRGSRDVAGQESMYDLEMRETSFV